MNRWVVSVVCAALCAAPLSAQDSASIDPLFGTPTRSVPVPQAPADEAQETAPTVLPARDQLVDPSGRPAFYVAVGYGFSDLGYAESELETDLNAATTGVTTLVESVDDTDGGVKLNAGYWVADQLALELGFVELGSVVSDFAFAGPVGSGDSVQQAVRDAHPVVGAGITGGARALLLDGADFDLTAKVGLFYWESENEFELAFNGAALPGFRDNRSGTDVFYGVGLHYDVADNWALQVEYELYRVEDETAGQLAVSARYSFDF